MHVLAAHAPINYMYKAVFISFLIVVTCAFLLSYANEVFGASWNITFDEYETGRIDNANSAWTQSAPQFLIYETSACVDGRCIYNDINEENINVRYDIGNNSSLYVSFDVKPNGLDEGGDVQEQFYFQMERIAGAPCFTMTFTETATGTITVDILGEPAFNEFTISQLDYTDIGIYYEVVNDTITVWKNNVIMEENYDVGDTGNNISLLKFYTSSQGDTYYYIDNLFFEPIDVNIVNYGNIFGYDLAADLDFVSPNICFIDENCYVSVNYNSPAIGGTVYLIPDDGSGIIFPDTAVSSTTLESHDILEAYLLAGNWSEATTSDWCLWYETSEYDTARYCGIKIIVTDRSAYTEIFGDYNLEDVCNGISTTSWFYYGIECGFRRLIYWSFVPTASSVDEFWDTVNSFNNVFPLNIYNQFGDAWNTVIGTSTQELDVPFMFGTTTYNDVTILSTSSIATAFGKDINNKIRNLLTYVVYMAMVFYVLQRVVFRVGQSRQSGEVP